MPHAEAQFLQTTDPRAALRLLAWIWASRSSGVLHVEDTTEACSVSFRDGGLARAEDEAKVGRSLEHGRLRFVPGGGGAGLRRPVARVLGTAALRGAPTEWPEGRPAPSLTLLAPIAVLEEIGLYPDFRWRLRTDGVFAIPTGTVALAAQVHALETLGWARVTAPASRTPSLSPQARPRLQSQPEAHLEEDLFSGALDPDAGHEDDTDTLSLEGFHLHDEEDHDVRARVAGAEALLAAGRWAEAERQLGALRDTRLDDPLVAALLARARLGDVATASPGALAEAERWAALARGLSTGTTEVEEALATFEDARARAASALAATTTHRRAG